MSRWTDRLPADVYRRLCACHNTREDLRPLVNAMWADMVEKGKKEQGFTKADALVRILDWLDSNNQYMDLTQDEWDELKED